MSPLREGAAPGSREMPNPLSDSLRVIAGRFSLSCEKLFCERHCGECVSILLREGHHGSDASRRRSLSPFLRSKRRGPAGNCKTI
jgi:hypothetical protein